MTQPHDIMESSEGNPNRVQFYRKDGGLRIQISVDRTTSVDRAASEQDVQDYARYFRRFQSAEAKAESALDNAGTDAQPKKRGRPRKVS